MTMSLLHTLPSLLDTMESVAVTESLGGREGTALAVEKDALTFFWEVKSSVKE